MAITDTPELLAPAGSAEALEAALAAGADAVYLGARSLNARHYAENFDDDELFAALRRCRALGVKTHITLNTQVSVKEIKEALTFVGRALEAGADAFIVADLGLADAIKSYYPSAVLHASTQASGQNAFSARTFEKLGFSRMVAPRELSKDDLAALCKNSPIEIEMFVHGALCVSFSGQCLMSSVIGGRSGNRGECAQPCRLPYKCACEYPLSLKDLSLAGHITDILGLGVASLKIEGRMKSADYVYGVTSLYRKLLDERRNATADEIAHLAAIFSRSGFTDGYFTKKVGTSMLGVRTEAQKHDSASLPKLKFEKRRLPIEIKGDFSRFPATVTASAARGVEKYVAKAVFDGEKTDGINPLGEERLVSSLEKCGDTLFKVDKINVAGGDGGAIKVSDVNALRREALRKLENELAHVDKPVCTGELPMTSGSRAAPIKTASFMFADAVTPRALDYFDRIFVPLGEYEKLKFKDKKIGIALPPICFDGEREALLRRVRKARDDGCVSVLATSLWQVDLLAGFEMFGDLRLNVNNAFAASVLSRLGAARIIASPEVSLNRAASFGTATSAVIYGRLPLMTTEKCVIRDALGISGKNCVHCDNDRIVKLSDRTGAEFIVCREEPHRNVIFNSVPVWNCDKADEYEKLSLGAHFIFTDESAADVDKIINTAKEKKPAQGKFKRI